MEAKNLIQIHKEIFKIDNLSKLSSSEWNVWGFVHLPWVVTGYSPGNDLPLAKVCLFFLLSYRGRMWYLQKFLQYIIVEFSPTLFSFISPNPHPRIVYFSIYVHVYIFPPYSPPYILSLYLPSSLPYWYQLPNQDLFCLPVLLFCKKKKNNIFVCIR
jgi:hypothetical protein